MFAKEETVFASLSGTPEKVNLDLFCVVKWPITSKEEHFPSEALSLVTAV